MDSEPTLSSSSDPEETMNTLLTLNQPWTTLNSSSDPETTLNPHLTLNYEVCFWHRNTCTDFESCFPAPTFSFISHFFLLVQLVVKKWENGLKRPKSGQSRSGRFFVILRRVTGPNLVFFRWTSEAGKKFPWKNCIFFTHISYISLYVSLYIFR